MTCVIATRFMIGSASGEEDVIKVLTIGSSFAENATEFLPQLAESNGVSIKVSKAANIGGSDLARHANKLKVYQSDPSDPEGRPYRNREDSNKPNHSLVEALESDDWDFVTLQQFSGDSFKPETYEPYSAQLIEAVHRYAPQAEIIVHQTWAYRDDHPFFADGTLTRKTMYEGLRAAYDELADRYGLKIVPVGDAFHIARSMPEWYVVIPDSEFNYENPVIGTLPDQVGSLNTGWFWKRDRETGAKTFTLDAKHANIAGRYLGACAFYETLTGGDARELLWKPDSLTEKQASTLRQAAHKAVGARILDSGFVSIFDGKTLDGWDGDSTYWSVEDGVLVGEVTPETVMKRNSFIIWRGGTPVDFELKVEYRVTRKGNSGLSYRNVQLTDAPWSLAGYQADIDGPFHDERIPRRRYTGQSWDERGRRFLARRGEIVQIDQTGEPIVIGSLGDIDELETYLNNEDWNEYHIIARGNVLTHIVNGHVMSIVIDDDIKNRRMEGLIGMQVHKGPPHKIEYRNLRLKNL